MTYSLTNDDSGRFRVDSQGRLYKAKDVNYETQTKHVIRAMVKDNGNPSMKVITAFYLERFSKTLTGNIIIVVECLCEPELQVRVHLE